MAPPRRDRLPRPRPADAATAPVPRSDVRLSARRLLALALALVATLAACSGDDDDADDRAVPGDGSVPAMTFAEAAAGAFGPLGDTARELPDHTRRWLAGELPEADYRRTLATALQSAEDTRRNVELLPEHDAQPLYLASAELYVQYERVLVAALDVEPGPLRDQVLLLARRLRQLADRVFDRGLYYVDPDFGADQGDIIVNLPGEVPDWEAEGMAAGPPLDDEPGPPSTSPSLREDERPTQPQADWIAAVDAAGAPDRLDLDGDLAAQARDYVDAAEALRDEPDPDVPDGRERSVVLRLSWLVKADAARAAQAGLRDIAEAIDAIEL